MEMGEKIKQLRLKRGMTLEQLGDCVGVGKSTVRKWENGMIANMRRDKIAKIAKALGVSPGYLMGWDDDDYQDDSKESISGKKYYFSDETAEMAQRLFDDPDTRLLFDAARDCSPEDLRIAADLLKRFKETNPDG